ncbi:extensin family protein [Marinicella sp. W31]|uniref:extensin-like domain-containing protein n=1 Tax=Marinicella sp. W31 TaxID=3023713 RepID=UPI003757A25D
MQIIPAGWKPWIPFTIKDPMDTTIQEKLRHLSPQSCLSIVAETAPPDLQYATLSDHKAPSDCQLKNVLLVHHTTLELPQAMIIHCPLLTSWLMFEQQQLQPLARKHLGSEVEKLRLYSSFSCRNVYGRESGKRSQHANAAALDIGGFTLTDGTQVSVLNHWSGNDAKSAFLKAVRDQACHYFGTVLGPEYNDAHHNHFHMDLSANNLCQ